MWHTKNSSEFSSKTGVKQDALEDAYKKYGYNEIRKKTQKSIGKILLGHFANPFVIILCIAALLQFFLGSYVEGIVILVTVVVMVCIAWVQEAKAAKAMEALLDLASPCAHVQRENKIQKIASKYVVPEDLLVLKQGDKVTADARLLQVEDLQVDESCLTGEALPVKKHTEALKDNTPISEQANMVFCGTVIVQGKALAYVTNTGMNTVLGKIAESIEQIEKSATPLQKSIDRLSRYMLGMVLSFSFFFAVLGKIFGLSWSEIALLAIAMAVAAIPEGLPATLTVILAVGVHRISKKRGLVRNLLAVETLGAINVLCTDKTGTLTKNSMSWTDLALQGITLPCEQAHCLEGHAAYQKLLTIAFLCNQAEQQEKKYRGDPTDIALLQGVHAQKSRFVTTGSIKEKLFEVPFSSERRCMISVYRLENQVQVLIKGAPEKILSFSRHYLGEKKAEPLSSSMIASIQEQVNSFAQKGDRVLAAAYKIIEESQGVKDHWEEDFLKNNLTFVGLYGIRDPVREEVPKAIAQCLQAGIQVLMITGDAPNTAMAIGQELKLESQQVLEGKQIEKMSAKTLLEAIKKVKIFARIEPLHKLHIVRCLQKENYIVGMTGDGVNDAAAITKADIGIAMGKLGTEAAKDAADIILTDDRFATIVDCIEEGRAIFTRIRCACAFLLMTCFGEVATIFFVFAFWQQSPLNPLQILWINLITGSLIAIPIGLEPKTITELDHPPRETGVGLLYPGMLYRIFILSLLFSMASCCIFSFYSDNLLHARTMTFATMVLLEWFLAFHMRFDESSTKTKVLENKTLVGMGLLAIVFLVVIIYVPFFQYVFHTTFLSIIDWLVCILPGGLLYFLESCRKRWLPRLFTYGKWRKEQWD